MADIGLLVLGLLIDQDYVITTLELYVAGIVNRATFNRSLERFMNELTSNEWTSILDTDSYTDFDEWGEMIAYRNHLVFPQDWTRHYMLTAQTLYEVMLTHCLSNDYTPRGINEQGYSYLLFWHFSNDFLQKHIAAQILGSFPLIKSVAVFAHITQMRVGRSYITSMIDNNMISLHLKPHWYFEHLDHDGYEDIRWWELPEATRIGKQVNHEIVSESDGKELDNSNYNAVCLVLMEREIKIEPRMLVIREELSRFI